MSVLYHIYIETLDGSFVLKNIPTDHLHEHAWLSMNLVLNFSNDLIVYIFFILKKKYETIINLNRMVQEMEKITQKKYIHVIWNH